MSAKNNFVDAVHTANKHRSTILLTGLQAMLLVLVFIGFVLHTGMYGIGKQVVAAVESYQSDPSLHNATSNVTNPFIAQFENDQVGPGFGEYLKQHGVTEQTIAPFFTWRTVWIALGYLLAWLLLSLLLTTMLYVSIARAVNKKPQKELFASAVQRIGPYVLYSILCALLYGLPVLIVGALLVGLGMLGGFWIAIAVITGILALIGYIVYVVFISLRFYFAPYILFLENTSALQAFKKSYALTKGNMLRTLGVFAIEAAICYVGYSLGPYSTAILHAVFGSRVLVMIAAILLFILYVLIYSTLNAIAKIYVFYSCKRFGEK